MTKLFSILALLAFAYVAYGLPVVTANEVEATDRLYNMHQKFTLEVARKIQELREKFDGRLDRAPATLIVPLIDKAVRHMGWAKAYAPNEESRRILEFNAKNLERLRDRIMNSQTDTPKSNTCTGDDKWMTV